MIRYFLNFWVWWYVVKASDFLKTWVGYWGFILNYMDIPAMATNLFVPFYQDTTLLGRGFALTVRSGWVLVGSLAMIVITIPMILIYLIYLVIPILPVLVFGMAFINWIK